jgi:pimeloyl-ACP methyl ester carboxylesterase
MASRVVLVHGGFVDGSGWEGVYNILKEHGHDVSVVQNPTTSLADDVAVTKRVIAARDGPVPPILPPQDGFLFLDKAKFASSFAADVDPERAAFMADARVPWGVDALVQVITEPAWKNKPSWYMVTTEDKMIPPPAQQFMSQRAGSKVVQVQGSHSLYVSHPDAVAAFIEQATAE